MARVILIQTRRSTAAQWTAANPTLAAGEPGWESDTNKLKVGDGATAWNALAYFAPGTGVSSFAQSGQTALTGAVTISPGAGVTMSQVGQNVAISSTASGSGSSDGWLDDTAETWTFASFTAGPPAVGTFTVAGDLRTKYTVGSRIKLTQTTAKYFVISVAPTFGGGNTTVTINGGTDYTLANAAISANYHSYEVNPQGWPSWFNFTPSPAGYTGSPTVFARFHVVDRTCTFYIDVTGTSNATTKTFTAPMVLGPGNTDNPFIGATAAITNNGVQATTPGRFSIANASATITVARDMTNLAWTNSGTALYGGTGLYEI